MTSPVHFRILNAVSILYRTGIVRVAFWQCSGFWPHWCRKAGTGVYVLVIWRMASWKDSPRIWTWKSMALPARLRSGQRQ
jgi:hypothetical protein